jgi:hypothetical protein
MEMGEAHDFRFFSSVAEMNKEILFALCIPL